MKDSEVSYREGEVEMDKRKRSLLYALSMFDGYVRPDGLLQVSHCDADAQYSQWKADMFHSAFGGKAPSVNSTQGQTRWTKSHPYLKQIRRVLYPDGVRQWSTKALDMLDEQGLAIWYLDDGTYRTNVGKDGWIGSVATSISTSCSQHDAELIQAWFEDRWDVHWKIRRNRHLGPEHECFLDLNTGQSRHFIRLIEPYVPQCMVRKLAHVADMTTHERQAPVGHCSACNRVVYQRIKGLCRRCYLRQWRQREQDDEIV